jgi:UDP-N-acetylglucosamine--N-acetylmuramyl-(pentapeptide) pyrophosphoryl-undecaprenol N-acetylglucosamine transferase
MKELKILLTGGGTGGHVFPAIAIAHALKAAHPDAQFLFVGAEGKMEMERVPQAGYAIEGLPVAGFQRGLSWTSLRRNLSFPLKLWRSSVKARAIIKNFQPDVVIGTGGYASGPVMRAAQTLGIPTLIQEQNSWPGVTNKLLAKKAARICTAYEGMEAFFPAEKIVLTGNPVREDILNIKNKSAEAYKYFNLAPDKKTILITGGSLGARTLNEAVVAGKDQLEAAQADIQVLWQCGRFYHDRYKGHSAAQLPNVKLVPFIDRVDLAYAAADTVISRAGALSISELCLVGKPVILVPSPNVAEDHQTKNALALTQIGAARLIRDAEAVEKLIEEALMIVNNDALSFSLGESIRQMGTPGAAKAIAQETLKIMMNA